MSTRPECCALVRYCRLLDGHAGRGAALQFRWGLAAFCCLASRVWKPHLYDPTGQKRDHALSECPTGLLRVGPLFAGRRAAQHGELPPAVEVATRIVSTAAAVMQPIDLHVQVCPPGVGCDLGSAPPRTRQLPGRQTRSRKGSWALRLRLCAGKGLHELRTAERDRAVREVGAATVAPLRIAAVFFFGVSDPHMQESGTLVPRRFLVVSVGWASAGRRGVHLRDRASRFQRSPARCSPQPGTCLEPCGKPRAP